MIRAKGTAKGQKGRNLDAGSCLRFTSHFPFAFQIPLTFQLVGSREQGLGTGPSPTQVHNLLPYNTVPFPLSSTESSHYAILRGTRC
jgi:hypothetical protein